MLEAYGNFLERQGRNNADAADALPVKHIEWTPPWRRWCRPGLAQIAAGQKPGCLWSAALAEDARAERRLFGIAASLTDQASADISILYLRMALYLRPDLALAQILLADRFGRDPAANMSIPPSPSIHAIEQGLARLSHGGGGRGARSRSGWARKRQPSPT